MRDTQEQRVIDAIVQGKQYRGRNTEVAASGPMRFVNLHGSRIAVIDAAVGVVRLYACGYRTNVTKNRLNILLTWLCKCDGRIHAKNYTWFVKDKEVFVEGMEFEIDYGKWRILELRSEPSVTYENGCRQNHSKVDPTLILDDCPVESGGRLSIRVKDIPDGCHGDIGIPAECHRGVRKGIVRMLEDGPLFVPNYPEGERREDGERRYPLREGHSRSNPKWMNNDRTHVQEATESPASQSKAEDVATRPQETLRIPEHRLRLDDQNLNSLHRGASRPSGGRCGNRS